MYSDDTESRFVNNISRQLIKYTRTVQIILAKDTFRPPGDKKNPFVLAFGSGKNGGDLCVAKVLLLYTISAGPSIDSQEYALMYYMAVTVQVDTADETFWYVCLG